jgi:hypothetical protein
MDEVNTLLVNNVERCLQVQLARGHMGRYIVGPKNALAMLDSFEEGGYSRADGGGRRSTSAGENGRGEGE